VDRSPRRLDGDPLLPPAAQLVRPMTRTLGEGDEIEEFLSPSLRAIGVFWRRGALAARCISSAVSVGDEVKNWKTKPACRNRYWTGPPSLKSSQRSCRSPIRPRSGGRFPKDIQERRLTAPRSLESRRVSPSAMRKSRPAMRLLPLSPFDRLYQVLSRISGTFYHTRSLRTASRCPFARSQGNRTDVTSIRDRRGSEEQEATSPGR